MYKLPRELVIELREEISNLNRRINSLGPDSWKDGGYAHTLQAEYDKLVLKRYPEAVEELRMFVEQDVVHECRNTLSGEDFEEFIASHVEGQQGWWFDATVDELLEYE